MQLVLQCYTAVLYEPIPKLFIYQKSAVYLSDARVTFVCKIQELRNPTILSLGFPMGTILTFFYLQVSPILLVKFQVNWSVQENKLQMKFQVGRHDGHFGFLIRTI